MKLMSRLFLATPHSAKRRCGRFLLSSHAQCRQLRWPLLALVMQRYGLSVTTKKSCEYVHLTSNTIYFNLLAVISIPLVSSVYVIWNYLFMPNVNLRFRLRWVTTRKQKWCQFLENLHKYSLKYIGLNHAKQIMGYHACFWDILTNITHEIRDKTTYYHPLGLVSDYGGLSYHFMSKLYSNISKPSMVTHHLLGMDETHVLPEIFLEIFKKMTSLLFFFVVTHLNCS